MNYIYVDTKINGAIEQLISYFDSMVFNSDEFIVFYKDYKKETKHFSTMLSFHGIKHYAFKRYSELKIEDGSIIFYLFNAQSNCRIVSNRKCIHIFVTHGESNKVSSIKPIIRIYDYIAVAGELGINRYLNNKIFYRDDVKRNKLIRMGDTFIGQNNFYYFSQSKYIVYAPTWEGGVSDENYSSLEWKNIFEKFQMYLKNISNATLIIQPHPNLGHRQKKYQKYLYQGIEYLLKNKISVILIKNSIHLKDRVIKIKYRGLFSIAKRSQSFSIKEAFTDISAMETQFYAKNIPTRIFLKEELNWPDEILVEHYNLVGIIKTQNIESEIEFNRNYQRYLLSYHNEVLAQSPLNERIKQMINLIKTYHLHF